MTLKWILKFGWNGKACVYLATGKNKWLAVVNAIMKLMVSLNAGKSLTN
jgi:hypothetical protein